MKAVPRNSDPDNRMYLRNLMLDAWSLASTGADKFGGNRHEYVPLALAMAWQDTKNNPAAKATAQLAADFRMR